MQAETLNCPMCGAATSCDQPQCQYCRSRLATISGASCFGMMFIGTRHCPRCGAAAVVRSGGTLSACKCPRCRVEMELMNRINFARCSGVIVDVCKGHGTWFDRDELSRIVEFIRTGGLEVTRAKEKAEIEDERRRLRAEQLAVDRRRSGVRGMDEEQRILGIASARGLLKLLLE